jgi:hypothetical protein
VIHCPLVTVTDVGLWQRSVANDSTYANVNTDPDGKGGEEYLAQFLNSPSSSSYRERKPRDLSILTVSQGMQEHHNRACIQLKLTWSSRRRAAA